ALERALDARASHRASGPHRIPLSGGGHDSVGAAGFGQHQTLADHSLGSSSRCVLPLVLLALCARSRLASVNCASAALALSRQPSRGRSLGACHIGWRPRTRNGRIISARDDAARDASTTTGVRALSRSVHHATPVGDDGFSGSWRGRRNLVSRLYAATD